MWNFFVRIYRNLLMVYVIAMAAFSYHMLMSHIPDRIYVREGESVRLTLAVPVQVYEKSDAATQSLFDLVRAQTGSLLQETADFGSADTVYEDCELTCYLFGVIPVKDIEVQVVEKQEVYASGRVIGIYEQTDGVLVLKTTEVENADGETCAPAETIVKSGDYICSVNDVQIATKEELVEAVQENKTKPLTLGLLRGGEAISVTIRPVETADQQYLLGIWVKDDIAGIGTLTWYDADGSFGALGHGIGDGETGELLSVSAGRIYTATLIGITKGQKGTPGQLEGVITYSAQNLLGTIASNSNIGIYGTLDAEDTERFAYADTLYPVAYKQEIRSGIGYLLSDISGSVEAYEIEITDVDYSDESSNKSIHFEVTDERLLELTGGIVQGMSGSPILQGGSIIGAVTHVMVSDPARGYGIFIESMLAEE